MAEVQERQLSKIFLGNVWLVILLSLFAMTGCKSPEERAQAYYENGVKLLKQGDPIRASLEFRNALRVKDNFVPALYSLGLAEEQQGHFDSAAKIYLAVRERSPDHVDSRVHIASMLAMAGQFDDAQKFADEAYSLAPSDPKVLALKAAVALKRENRGDAVRFADAALKIDPKNVDALIVRAAERLAASDPSGALAFLDRSRKSDQTDVTLQLLRINVLSALQDEQGVEGVFKSLIKFYPEDPAFRKGLVRWYLSRGRTADAEQVLRQVTIDNPNDTQAELDVVAFLKEKKGVDAAKAELLSRIQEGGKAFPFKLALAQLTFASGDYSGAVEQMRELIAETDRSSTDGIAAKLQLARMMMSRNDTADAEQLVQTILADDGKNADALTLRATIHMRNGRLADAIEDLRAATNEAPQSGPLRELLADAYERNGDVTLAEEEYAKAAASGQGPAAGIKYAQFLLRYGKLDQAERALTNLSVAEPRNKQVLALLAQVKLAKQDWVGAQKLSDALRTLDNGADEHTADRILASALAGEKKYKQSVKLLESALAAGTKDYDSSVAALVRTYLQAGEPAKAEEFLRSRVTSEPNDVQAHVLLGSVYSSAGKLDDAEEAFKAAIEKDPKSPLGYSALGEFYGKTKRFDLAEKTLREGLKHHGNDNVLRLLLAMTLNLSGQYDAAITEYETLLAADPRSTIAANNLANLLSEHRNDPASLDRAYSLASRFTDSEVAQFLDTFGWISYLKGKYDQAVLVLRKAADKAPDSSPSAGAIQFHLAMTYKELGLTDRARETLKKAIRLLPKDSPDVSKARAALAHLASSDDSTKKTN
jgi:tetratricopeptide (TPR) repeat protein